MTITPNQTTIQPASKRMTLDEYLNYDDDTETRYELVDGILVEVPTENLLNNTIALFLVIYFSSQLGIPHHRFATYHQI
jgi:Uma2 family endonuclease